MTNTFLIKYGEIGIKGDNRHIFEDALAKRIRTNLKHIPGDFKVTKTRGRIYVRCEGDYDYDETVDVLARIFGIVGVCPVEVYESGDIETLKENIAAYARKHFADSTASFKVHARRIDKEFPLTSMEVSAILGDVILETVPTMHVDVHTPDVLFDVELREEVFVYSKVIPGPGGMPVGSAGKAMLLLSGGIDSPVAGYMTAKRGVLLDAVYFHAPPYTSERAKQKVIDLAKILARYTGPIYLRIVNFTDIQLKIYDECPHEELTIIMRRYMMRIAERFAKENNDLGLVTGESIGQVASQTMMSLIATNAAATLPVYRPLCGFDKSEIVALSKEIGAYETSILPYEDCCTIFVAKHPVTKPQLAKIEQSEKKLGADMDALVEKAIREAEAVLAK